MALHFSIIIPVYNRPDEVDVLLESLTRQSYSGSFEIVVVEDGSRKKCNRIVDKYREDISIKYLLKANTGAGLSRNFGMKNAEGNYFIILDSDVILPPTYLNTVAAHLKKNYTDSFGAPDRAHSSFSSWQKAVSYSMTSRLTTGGLRGKTSSEKFQLRSFNMGLSKKAFKKTGGFSARKIGEDIELYYRLRQMRFTTQLIPEAFVYHKRRTTLLQFFKQTYRFGKERPLLNKKFSGSGKLAYWFPLFFTIGVLLSIFVAFYGCYLPILTVFVYLLVIFIDSGVTNKSISVGLKTVFSTLIQFTGYGLGFLVGKFKT